MAGGQHQRGSSHRARTGSHAVSRHLHGAARHATVPVPLFYTAHSYPNLRLNNAGRFAVCMDETSERRPLEYPEDEGGSRPIDDRMRLAHDRPANPADYTTGATQEDGIEILPKAE